MSQRIYKYRKQIRWGQYFVPVIFNVPSLIFLSLYFTLPQTPKIATGLPSHLIWSFSLFPIVMLVLGILFWYLYYRLAGVSFSIQKGTIAYANRSSVSILRLEDISSLKFCFAKYCGGWIKIDTPEKSVRMTVVVEDISEFLLELKVALDSLGLSDRYDRSRFFRFLTTATYADQSWTRVYLYFWQLVVAMALSILLGAVCAALAGIWKLGALVCLLITIGPLCAYFGAEFELCRKFFKATDEESFFCPPRDLELEKRVYREAAWAWGVICLMGLVIALLIRMWRDGYFLLS